MLYSPAQTADADLTVFRYLRVELNSHVLMITLNRPAKKNALHPLMLAELAFAVAVAQHNPAVWLVVLAAEGDTFCAGMDLRSLSVGQDAETLTVPEPAGPVRLGDLMAGLHKPSVARVQGPVYAGGFLLVAGATFAIGADVVTFSLPEVRRGLFPFQVLATLQQLMPTRQALGLCLRAQTLTAFQAQTLGLLTDVVAADALDEAVNRLCDELKQVSPTAMQFGLRAAQTLPQLPVDEQQRYMYEEFTRLQQTPDAREGMVAFLEKRPPVWT
jgi:enoyl-CoA hydratase/carnithine racemase